MSCESQNNPDRLNRPNWNAVSSASSVPSHNNDHYTNHEHISVMIFQFLSTRSLFISLHFYVKLLTYCVHAVYDEGK